MFIFTVLVLLPIVVSILLWKIPLRFMQSLMLLFSFVLSVFSTYLFLNPLLFSFSLSSFFHGVLIFIDTLLILYFLKEGLKFKDQKVWLLALIQLVLFVLAEFFITNDGTHIDFIGDELSLFMFTIINIVGSLIIVFAVWYIKKESIEENKQRLFLFYLTLFLTIMNLIVVANSLMIFFLLFEMTTLASYLLIGFRKDTLSQNNALKALWMNQIGGVAILVAVLFAISIGVNPYFDQIINNTSALFVVSFLCIAALIKGAQTPFDSWLLGAMVAPTPVSAILHSATMVKIAPFLILKLAPSFEGTFLAQYITIFGSFVFIIGAIYGLSKDKLKEVLGYSTISLLGLMVAMAASAGEEHKDIVYILIFFHAVSKALLFLLAGILEKNYHLKDISQMSGLLQLAPLSTMMIMLGFATITLPPFGLFFGKLFSIELVAKSLHVNFSYLVLLLSLAIGSAVLTMLYFKVASLLFSKNAEKERFEEETFFSSSMIAPYIYVIILIASTFILVTSGIDIPLEYMYISLGLILIIPIWIKIDPFSKVDRVKEYYCGEQEYFGIAQYSYDFTEKIKSKIALIGIGAYLCIALGGLL